MKIEANLMHFRDLSRQISESGDRDIVIDRCMGQSFIGAGLKDKEITINGIPGNALGAYLNGAEITVNGNAQDATGDTMNEGKIIIHGSSGDATGYAMRGGKIFVKNGVGYRAGIHMKAYQDKLPVLVVGGTAGSFLGEYQAGGVIVVLGLDQPDGDPPIGNFCATGMHGGKIFLRCEKAPENLPGQVMVDPCEDTAEIAPLVTEYCRLFGGNAAEILQSSFYVLTPNTKNPYKQLYTQN